MFSKCIFFDTVSSFFSAIYLGFPKPLLAPSLLQKLSLRNSIGSERLKMQGKVKLVIIRAILCIFETVLNI